MRPFSRQVGIHRVALAAVNLLLLASLLLNGFTLQVAAEPQALNSAATAPARNAPPTSAAPASSTNLALAIVPSALITISTGGFTPDLLSTNAAIPVVWVNATNVTQTLESGTPNQIYLPLIARGATGTATDRAPTAPSGMPHASGTLFNVSIAPGGRFTYTFDVTGTYPYFVRALFPFTGKVYIGDPLPSDPALIAPPVDTSVATNLCAATRFLYTSGTPIQTGVISGTIACQRTAVLRGQVIQRDGTPLSGVVITILNHPEYGQTLSRADGMFDLAVNGGGSLTVNYSKVAFLSAQRQVTVPWQDYVVAPAVALIAVDPRVTTVTVPAGGLQVARGSVISDSDGLRQATLFFLPGVTATLEYSGGVRQTVSTLHVRATEYTVGPTGPAAMPGDLPPNSGYTYATEFSVDEVANSNAQDVLFSQPVIDYLENFLGFPIGINVPAGYYDRKLGQWLPSANGRVVKVLSITSGKADLDVDGSNTAASPAMLAALGIGDAERTQLALLYVPGASLWRTPVAHFSAWDKNWGFGPPPLADGPNLPDEGGGGPGRGRGKGGNGPDDCNCQPKLNDQSDNQTAGDSMGDSDEAGAAGPAGGVGGGGGGGSAGVAGSPFSLQYESDRVPGRIEANTIQIPLSGITVPVPLKRIDLEVLIAGRTITESFPAQINQSTTFLWDGKDAYGRTLQGRQPATVRIGYVYDGVYQIVPKFGYNGNGTPISGSKTRREVTLWQEQQTTVGVLDTRGQGLGGWTLDVHHAYDPQGQVLYMGDGRRRSVQAVANIITSLTSGLVGSGISLGADGSIFYTTNSFNNNRVYRLDPAGHTTIVAGSGGLCIGTNLCGDGGPATAALLAPFSVQVAPDGSLLIVDTAHIRRIDATGIITTVAGTGIAGFSGDGGPARLAQIGSQSQVRGAPDGSLYIADLAANRVRRVSPDGTIDTVAGNGAVCTFATYPCGDGGPATQATFVSIYDLAVAPDGVLYIAEEAGSFGGRVRRVGTDGIITTFAGGGAKSPGDGERATDVFLKGVHWLAVGPDGSVYAEDQDQVSFPRVRRIGPDGRISTIAGTGVAGYNGDGGPATAAQLSYSIAGIAVGPDGRLYIQDFGNSRIRRVAPPLPAYSASDIAIASDDGLELYQFNSLGRHLRTLNTLTGAALYVFGYDAGGRLTTVTDGAGNVTTIQHDGSGNPTAIIGPYGQQSALSVDSNGYLASLTDPLGHVYQHTYTPGGLLTSSTDPNVHTRILSYDSLGRLASDSNAAGGATLFARSDITTTSFVTSVTPLSRTWQFQVANLLDGSLLRTTVDPAGLQFVSSTSASGQTNVQSPDGRQAVLVDGPDPRWGMQSPIPAGISFSTPGGMPLNVQASSAVVLTDSTQLLSLVAQTDMLSFNGRVYTSAYDAASRTFNETSPMGRQVVTTIDPLGQPVQQQVADLLPTALGYDARGRLVTATIGTGPNERSAWLGYDANGFPSTVIDSLGRSTTFGYDANGRVLTQTLTDGRSILYGYDAAGNVTSFTPPGRPAHTFSYSLLNETTVYTPPVAPAGSLSTHYAYNDDGQLTQIVRPDGRGVTIGYDGAGRPATLNIPRGQLGFQYDPVTGNLITVTAPGGINLAYHYDGSLPLSEQWSGPVSGAVARGYDNSFRIISQTVNGSSGVAYAYDTDGLLVQAGALVLNRNLVNGLLISSTLNNVSDVWNYDGFGEPIGYSASYNSTPLLGREYAYDALGRVTVLSDTLSGSTTVYSYTYDLAGRLSAVAHDGAPYSAYSYDSNGNRLSTTGPGGVFTGTYDAQDRLLQYGSSVFSYTANGELLTKTNGVSVTTYTYDELGSLMHVSLPGGTPIDYLVDGRNRRIGKKVNGALTQGFLYGDGQHIVAELDGSSNVVSRFVYGSQLNISDYILKGGNTYRILADNLGSPRLVVDVATGAIAQRMDFDEFGRVLTDTNPGFQPFGFAGGIYDRDTGLVRFGARDYNPQTGRWTAKDPTLFNSGDPNLYDYVQNDPVNASDLSGLGGKITTPLGDIPIDPLQNFPQLDVNVPISKSDLLNLLKGKLPKFKPDARIMGFKLSPQFCPKTLITYLTGLSPDVLAKFLEYLQTSPNETAHETTFRDAQALLEQALGVPPGSFTGP